MSKAFHPDQPIGLRLLQLKEDRFLEPEKQSQKQTIQFLTAPFVSMNQEGALIQTDGPQNHKVAMIEARGVGNDLFDGIKTEGVEIGHFVRKNWAHSDTKKLLTPLFKENLEAGKPVLANPNKMNKQRLIAIHFVAHLIQKSKKQDETSTPVNDLLLHQIDQSLNALLLIQKPNATEATIADIDADETLKTIVQKLLVTEKDGQTKQMFLSNNLQNLSLTTVERELLEKQHFIRKAHLVQAIKNRVRYNMIKYRKKHMRKMNYDIGRLGWISLPWDKVKSWRGLSFTKLFYWLARLSRPETINRDVIRECLANDLHHALGLSETQESNLLTSVHPDGRIKFFLNSKFGVGKEDIRFTSEKEGEEFSHPVLYGREEMSTLEAYETDTHKKGLLAQGAGYYVARDIHSKVDEKGNVVLEVGDVLSDSVGLKSGRIQGLGQYLPIFWLFGDRDALGRTGNNKLVNLWRQMLFIIDPGKSLSDPRLLRFLNLNSDFTLKKPSFWKHPLLWLAFLFNGGYKNFNLFQDTPLVEKMAGVRLIREQMNNTNADLKTFDAYQNYFEQCKADCLLFKNAFEKNNEIVANASRRVFYHQLHQSFLVGGIKSITRQIEFYDREIKEIALLKSLYKKRRQNLIYTFSEKNRNFLELNDDELTMVDHLEKLLSATSNRSAQKGLIVEQQKHTSKFKKIEKFIHLNHLRVKKREALQFEVVGRDDDRMLKIVVSDSQLARIQQYNMNRCTFSIEAHGKWKAIRIPMRQYAAFLAVFDEAGIARYKNQPLCEHNLQFKEKQNAKADGTILTEKRTHFEFDLFLSSKPLVVEPPISMRTCKKKPRLP